MAAAQYMVSRTPSLVTAKSHTKGPPTVAPGTIQPDRYTMQAARGGLLSDILEIIPILSSFGVHMVVQLDSYLVRNSGKRAGLYKFLPDDSCAGTIAALSKGMKYWEVPFYITS